MVRQKEISYTRLCRSVLFGKNVFWSIHLIIDYYTCVSCRSRLATINVAARWGIFWFNNLPPNVQWLMIGISVSLTASTLDLIHIITRHPILFEIIKYIALSYRLYLAYKIWGTKKLLLNQTLLYKIHSNTPHNIIKSIWNSSLTLE